MEQQTQKGDRPRGGLLFWPASPHMEYNQEFSEHAPQYSLLFSVAQDCFALCIDQLPEGGAPVPQNGAKGISG